MSYKGIDYGMGETNIDKANGIRFGVIGMNSEHLTEWAWESVEADYGDPTCGHCGNEAVEYDPEKHEKYKASMGGHDWACEGCELALDAEEVYGDEPNGHNLDDGEMKGFVDSHNDLMLLSSPYYTRAQFCSPCAPGACHLGHPMPDGEKAYCLGHDWFRGGLAPYPVFSVESDALVMPEWDGKYTGPDDERHLRTWAADGFVLEMYDTGKRDGRGQTDIAYRLADRGEVIFQGQDFSGSPMHADDADQTVAALLSFLSLKPGDTDKEYFDKYTPRQMEWCRERGEELSLLAMELEEGWPDGPPADGEQATDRDQE